MFKRYEDILLQAQRDFRKSDSPYRGNYLALLYREVSRRVLKDNIEENELKQLIKDCSGKKEKKKLRAKLLFTKGVPDIVFKQIKINIAKISNDFQDLWDKLNDFVHLHEKDFNDEFLNELDNVWEEIDVYTFGVGENIRDHLENGLWISNIWEQNTGKFDISGHDIYENFQLNNCKLVEFSKGKIRARVEGEISKDIKHVGIDHFPCSFEVISSEKGLVIKENSYKEDVSSFYS